MGAIGNRLPRIGIMLLLLLSLCSSAFAVQQYRAISILPEQYSGIAEGISSSGYVVGSCASSTGSSQAFIWDSSNGMRIYDSPDGTYCIPRAVNDSGQVVGQFMDAMHSLRAAYWDSDGRFHGLEYGCLYGISGSGLAVGTIGDTVGVYNMSNNALLTRAIEGRPSCINESGLIGGCQDDGQAWVWSMDGSDHALAAPWLSSSVGGLSDSGLAVGYCSDFPAVWDADGSCICIRPLSRTYSGSGVGINDSGVVAGTCFGLNSEPRRAFVWSSMDGIQELPGLGGASSQAYAINSSGLIVGTAYDASGVQRAVVWVPVPEPSTLAGIISGITGIGLLVRRRHLA